jgi:hypothetical protein
MLSKEGTREAVVCASSLRSLVVTVSNLREKRIRIRISINPSCCAPVLHTKRTQAVRVHNS